MFGLSKAGPLTGSLRTVSELDHLVDFQFVCFVGMELQPVAHAVSRRAFGVFPPILVVLSKMAADVFLLSCIPSLNRPRLSGGRFPRHIVCRHRAGPNENSDLLPGGSSTL